MQWPALNTVTFYSGDPPMEHLRGKLGQLLSSNPWLAGRLQRERGIVRLSLPGPPGRRFDPAPYFIEEAEADLNLDQSMETMRKVVGHLLVKIGQDCVDQDEPLFRVSVIRTGLDQFAVVVSLSHVLGDGHTYYQVYSALGQSAPFRPLNPFRKLAFSAAMAESLGQGKTGWLSSQRAWLGNLMSRLFKPTHKWGAWYVDEGWVGDQKRSQSTASCRDTPWISTNDVLTSWFLCRGRYSYGIMALNFRQRLCGLTASDAGNYEGGVQFWPDEFATPSGIRRSLQAAPHFRAGRDDTPGLWRSLGGHFGVVTNWASLQQVLSLPDCQQVLHLPLISDLLLDAMIVFRPTAGTLGVAMAQRTLSASSLGAALGARIR